MYNEKHGRMMAMKVLASDFDGTLFFGEDGFRESDLRAIERFQSAGHLFGVCTGRPLLGITVPVDNQIDLDFYILSSGALILDKQQNVIEKHVMSLDLTKRIYNDYRDQVKILIQCGGGICTFDSSNVPIQRTLIHSIDDIKDEIYGVSFETKSIEEARIICQQLNQTYIEIDAFQNNEFIDIVKKGCSKGNALKTLANYYKIDAIAGIGDSFNDIPMLTVSNPSFTFTYSPLEVQAKANQIVENIEEAIAFIM